MSLLKQFIEDLDIIAKNPDYEPKTFTINADGCYIWSGALTACGYGEVYNRRKRKVLYTHRIANEHSEGPIPKGRKWNVHHQCGVKACCRPEHLAVVSAKYHSAITWAARPPRIRCMSQRHLWIPENVSRAASGYPFCRLCRNESSRNAYDRKKRREAQEAQRHKS